MDSKLKHILIPFVLMMALMWITSKEKSHLKNTINHYKEVNIDLSEELVIKQIENILVIDENIAWKELYLSLPLGSPLDTLVITSHYGWRLNPITEKREHHDGVDLLAGPWDKVYSTGDGIIVRASWYRGLGKCVVIKHSDGYRSLYGHLSEINVSINDEVVRGQHIGMAGNTGHSVGYHLHYEIYKNNNRVNPIKFIQIGEEAQ
tara:strand:+ start:815 stop:1429 length:615 start_codon:yes stop_codon:yes gene_type:complete